jgi:cytochrome c-type biogenesis protein
VEAGALGLAVAFTAGVLSFLSPCVLPLVPSYASYITGMSLDDLVDARGTPRVQRTVLVHGGLFVLGFSAVFITLGASATFIGAFLHAYSVWVGRVGGVILIVFGLYLLGLLRLPGAEREWRVHLANKPVGFLGTFVVGVAFGAGWTPCIGPVLGGILTMAATSGSLGSGVALLAVYSLGLAIPFMLAALLLDRFLGTFARFRHWLPWISRASGVLLLVMGILLVTGTFTVLSGILARWTPAFLMERI